MREFQGLRVEFLAHRLRLVGVAVPVAAGGGPGPVDGGEVIAGSSSRHALLIFESGIPDGRITY
ncbi:hypothetical protein Jiend_63790 [Micromonospora endophytica]|nr:hypothetical protein D3H59_24930 [Micromonospora endophytica]BCJ62957.1 hypothetical protein Jiend_63790 [Micromonospora endophytica]